jgi:hypothetical protein
MCVCVSLICNWSVFGINSATEACNEPTVVTLAWCKHGFLYVGSTRSPVRTLFRQSPLLQNRAEHRRRHNRQPILRSLSCARVVCEPTRLRGSVALDTFVRYWSFSEIGTISGGGKKNGKKDGRRK